MNPVIQNNNFLSPLGFKLSITKLPKVSFFGQAVNIPSVSIGSVDVATPFVNLPLPGDHLVYSPLVISFKVDEDMTNYRELYAWMTGIGFPNNFNEAQSVYGPNPLEQLLRQAEGRAATSGASLLVLNSHLNTTVTVSFTDLFPINISELQFDSRNTDVKYIDCIATFRYTSFAITALGEAWEI